MPGCTWALFTHPKLTFALKEKVEEQYLIKIRHVLQLRPWTIDLFSLVDFVFPIQIM